MADHRLEIVLAAKDITGTAFSKVTGRVKALAYGVTSLKGGLFAICPCPACRSLTIGV